MSTEDITERFFQTISHLTPGEIVNLPEFSYLETMSAVELMDPKLDSGMALMGTPPIEQRIPSEELPLPKNLTMDALLSLIDNLLLQFAL